MRVTDATTRIAQFVERIRPHLDADTGTRLTHSIHGWIGAYHYLQVICGGYSPPAIAYMQEHFCSFAMVLLAHIADTFCYFFALPLPCAEVPHTRLTRIFPDLCTEKRLQEDVAGLHAAMRALQERVVVYGKTGPVSSTAWGEERRSPAPHDQLLEVLACIDQYRVAMLRFFAQNVERSPLRSAPPSPQT
jgi:hypothetical protein